MSDNLCSCSPDCTVPYGYCHCLCGGRTNICRANYKNSVYAIKGEPFRYIRGHQRICKLEDILQRYTEKQMGFDSPCWLWNGNQNENGYGYIKHKRINYRAHRFFYENLVGPIPKHLEPDHLCDIRHCVNPHHIQLTTHVKNSQRSSLSKLTMEDANQIRKLYETGKYTHKSLAHKYNVSPDAIGKVVRLESWIQQM